MTRRLSAVARRTAILLATCAVIARRGIRGLRVEEVAAQAGVSTTLLYHHFGNRSGLLAATLDHVHDRAGDYPITDGDASARARLVAGLVAEIAEDDQVRENSTVWNEFRAAAVFDAETATALAAATADWEAEVADLVACGQAEGDIDPDLDPAATAICLVACVEGLSGRWLTGQLDTAAARAHLHAAATHLVPR